MKFKTVGIALLSFALVEAPFSRTAFAGMIPTTEVVNNLSRAEQRSMVERYLQRADVKAQLAGFGVHAQEASDRVAALSDAEIEKISGHLRQAPAGADVLVISASTVLVVLLILILLGKL